MLIAIVIDRYAQVKLMLSGQETFWAQLAELFESYRKRGKGGEHLYDPERCLSFLSVCDRCYAKNTERITVMLPS